MLRVNNVNKKFVKNEKNKESSEFLAVNDISFEAKEGMVLGILGPNGAGKTTLLRMIGGIMDPNSGNITIDDMNYKDNETEIKKRIAYLSGNTKIYNVLSPYELLTMCGEFYEVDAKTIEKRIKEISKRLDMESFLYNRIDKLSTGQMQRVNIARTMVHDPKYYIFDEATSGLDILASQIILDFIKEERNRNKCILYSTHYMEEAENICDYVIMINKGKVLTTGTPDEIKKVTKKTNLRDAFFHLVKEDNNEE